MKKPNLKIFIICLFLTSITGIIFASPTSVSYHEACLNYENKDFEKAIEIYEGLIDKGLVSADLFYNLGK